MPIDVVCPACRHDGSPAPLERAERRWSCPRCGAVYPCLSAPVVAHPLGPFVRAVEPALSPDVSSLVSLAPWLADDAPSMQVLQRLAVATRSHWGDRLSPRVATSWEVWKPFLEVLPSGDVCELGCGAGRVSLELARDGRRVVGIDADPGALSLGVAVRDEGRASGVVREIGATYRDVRIEAPSLAGRDVTFVVADALNPPLRAESFDAVVALNLLDNVRVPATLIGQIDALLKPGGVALLSTPYAWDSAHTDDAERLGGAAGRPYGGQPEAELLRVLQGDLPGATWRFEVLLQEPRVPYVLTRDDRCRFVYDAHVVVVRKPA